MLKGKEIQLKNRLKQIINEIGHMKDVKEEIVNEFKLRNLYAYRATNVFTMNEPLDTIGDSEEDIRFLFLFTFALRKALNGKDIDVEDYFTQVEINQWKDYKEESEPKSIYPIIFEDVTEIIPGCYWQGVMMPQQLGKLGAANILIWNPNSQRGYKVTKKGLRINVDPGKVKEIDKNISLGKQFPDDLKFNIVKNGKEKFFYDPKKRTLTVFEGSVINTWDGQHRKDAILLALAKNPDLNYPFPIKITNFSEVKTHDCMTQINKQTPIKEEFLSSKDYSKNENLVIDRIMDLMGDLSNVTKDTIEYVNNDMGLTTKPIIAEAIKDNYEKQIELSMDRDELAEWIKKFTDYLMGFYKESFIIKPYEVKKDSYINNQNMFYGYIALSAKLRNDKDWKEKLKQKMGSIDFSKENPIWREIGLIGEGKINKTTKEKIYNLFKEEEVK